MHAHRRSLSYPVASWWVFFSMQNADRVLWKLGTLTSWIANIIYVDVSSWQVMACTRAGGSIDRSEIENAAVVHYNGNVKPWLELAMTKYRPYLDQVHQVQSPLCEELRPKWVGRRRTWSHSPKSLLSSSRSGCKARRNRAHGCHFSSLYALLLLSSASPLLFACFIFSLRPPFNWIFPVYNEGCRVLTCIIWCCWVDTTHLLKW